MPRTAAGPTRAAPRSRYACAAAAPTSGSAASRTTGARSSRTPSRTAGRSATAVPAPPTASQTDAAPLARSVRMASRASSRVRFGVPGPDVPAVGHRTARLVAPHERPPPGHADVRQVGDVGRGVERQHRDAVRGRPGQRLDPGPGRRGVVEPPRLAQHGVHGRDPGRPVRSGPVDEREHLRLVGCAAVECVPIDAVDALGRVDLVDLRGVHAPPPLPPRAGRRSAPAGVGGHGFRRRGGRSLCRDSDHRCGSRCGPQPDRCLLRRPAAPANVAPGPPALRPAAPATARRRSRSTNRRT